MTYRPVTYPTRFTVHLFSLLFHAYTLICSLKKFIVYTYLRIINSCIRIGTVSIYLSVKTANRAQIRYRIKRIGKSLTIKDWLTLFFAGYISTGIECPIFITYSVIEKWYIKWFQRSPRFIFTIAYPYCDRLLCSYF